MNTRNDALRRGDLYWADFTGRSVEQKGRRPALIVQNDIANGVRAYGITIVIPMSTKLKPYPSNVLVKATAQNGLDFDSDVIVGQLTAVFKASLGPRIGTLGPEDMERVEEALAYLISLPRKR